MKPATEQAPRAMIIDRDNHIRRMEKRHEIEIADLGRKLDESLAREQSNSKKRR